MSLMEIQELLEKIILCLALPFLFAELFYWASAGQEHVAIAWLDHKLGRVIG